MKSVTRLHPSTAQRAFTCAELLVILTVVTVLGLVILPALANGRPRSHRVICANNLRQIGLAVQLWSNDHGDDPPWEVTTSNGGTRIHPLAVNTWFQFYWMSNELRSPKILFCPSDSGQPAWNFGNGPDGGYVHSSFRNAATSYVLSHAFERVGSAMIAADRNLGFDGTSGGCNRFGPAWEVSARPLSSRFRWNTNLHNSAGNLLRLDGRVDQISNTMLDTLQLEPVSDTQGQFMHLLFPR